MIAAVRLYMDNDCEQFVENNKLNIDKIDIEIVRSYSEKLADIIRDYQ